MTTSTPGMTNLAQMLASLGVAVRPEPYVFASVDAGDPAIGHAAATVAEDEGVTVVLAERSALALQIPAEPQFAWLTLTIHSSLEAVGLTAAFSRALADGEISCNVLAGYRHDHLLVPYDERNRAVATLLALRSAPDAPDPSAQRAD